jgi:serine/threonine-protein kinase
MLVCSVCESENSDRAVSCARCGAELRRNAATVPGAPLASAVAPPSVAAPHVAPSAPPPPTNGSAIALGSLVDGKYRVESVLGEGGMGVVYLAHDVNTDTKVVIKALLPELAENPEFRERVRGEARALAQIDHPNVVRLNAVVASDQQLHLIMQYVEGRSLDRIIESHVAMRTPVPLDEALALFRQIVLGVGAAHAAGVVHRDIKPGNVLVRARDGVAKVTDFGIAKGEADAKAGRGLTKGIIGSLWYMSPEQLTGRRDLDKRVDIYALGILFYELLTGRVPFDAPSDYEIMKLHVEAPLPRIAAVRGDVPAALDDVVAHACAKDREQRFTSTNELLAALDRAVAPPARPSTKPLAIDAGPSSVAAPSVGPASQAVEAEAPAPSRLPWIVGGALAVGGAVAVGLWALSGPAPVAPPVAPVASERKAAAGPAPSSTKPADPMAPLVGRWISDTGRHYDAALGPDGLEVRVRDPGEFPGQNYEVGEARFTLGRTADPTVFTVEDKIRPSPPTGLTYAPVSRGTCQELWSKLGTAPLRGYWDGTKLRVDLVKITPARAAFEIKDGKIVGCQRLGASPAERVESTLTRE